MNDNKTNSTKWISLVCFLILVFGLEGFAGLFTQSSVHSWYLDLQKPSWNPPAWVFAPVWTILYLSIGIAGWLIFLQPPSKQREQALQLYGVQLLFNFAWSFLFFFLKSPGLGLIDIVLLLVFIGWTIIAFRPLSRLASLLLLPYLLWTAYALTLNVAIYYLNVS